MTLMISLACSFVVSVVAGIVAYYICKWLDRDKNNLQGTVAAMPARDDIDFEIEEHLIVELYSK